MSVRTNLVIDIVIGLAFLVAANPPVGGPVIHEWFGLAFAAAIVVHLVLHWDWTVSATKRLASFRGKGLRLNYAIDAVLFVAMTTVILSGLLISKHVLVAFGLPAEPGRGWRHLHSMATNITLAAAGLHIGLHWNWVVVNLSKLMGTKVRKAERHATDGRQPSVANA
jgi:hypothetical protein